MAFEVRVFNSRGRLVDTHRRISSEVEAREIAKRETSIKGQTKWKAVYTFMGKHIATYRGGAEVAEAASTRASRR